VYYVLVASRHYKHHQPVKEIKEEGRQLQPERKKEHDRIRIIHHQNRFIMLQYLKLDTALLHELKYS
jgi:hypothetical protein